MIRPGLPSSIKSSWLNPNNEVSHQGKLVAPSRGCLVECQARFVEEGVEAALVLKDACSNQSRTVRQILKKTNSSRGTRAMEDVLDLYHGPRGPDDVFRRG